MKIKNLGSIYMHTDQNIIHSIRLFRILRCIVYKYNIICMVQKAHAHFGKISLKNSVNSV